jgi:transcriptional regulator GlxA family with amidase domain
MGARAYPSIVRARASDWIKPGDRRGSVSFTPGGRERHGSVSRAEISGIQLELDHQFVEDACEQRLHAPWRTTFNSQDVKAFAIAETAAKNVARGAYDRLTLDTLLLALARHVGRAYANADRRRDDGWLHPAALARVIEQVRAECPRSVPLHEMARSAGIGVSAFVRAFRGSTGFTPAAFALKLRMDHASHILRATDLPISEIAAMSGFASASHLIRAFRAHKGVTPGHWRRADKRVPEL